MSNKQFWTRVSLLLMLGIAPISFVTSAYAAQLNAIGLVSPSGKFVPETKSRKDLGKLFELQEFERFDFTRTIETTTKTPLVVNSETFLNRWTSTVKKHKNAILWSAYPAAIRGQVFSNSPPGGSPLESGGW